MFFNLVIFLAGAASCYLVVVWRLSEQGDTLGKALVRPLGAGGTGPRK